MNTSLIEHMAEVWKQSEGQYAKLYYVKLFGQQPVTSIRVTDEYPYVMFDERYLPPDTFKLTLPEYSSTLIWSLYNKAREIGFVPVFSGKSQFNGVGMDLKTYVICPTEVDAICLQAYLDTLESKE